MVGEDQEAEARVEWGTMVHNAPVLEMRKQAQRFGKLAKVTR